LLFHSFIDVMTRRWHSKLSFHSFIHLMTWDDAPIFHRFHPKDKCHGASTLAPLHVAMWSNGCMPTVLIIYGIDACAVDRVSSRCFSTVEYVRPSFSSQVSPIIVQLTWLNPYLNIRRFSANNLAKPGSKLAKKEPCVKLLFSWKLYF